MSQALPPVRLGDQEPHAVDLLAVLDAAFARAAGRCRQVSVNRITFSLVAACACALLARHWRSASRSRSLTCA